MALEIELGATQCQDPSTHHANVQTVYCAIVDVETCKITLVVSHGGDMNIKDYIDHKYPLDSTDSVQRWMGILGLKIQAANALVHVLETHHGLYTNIEPTNFMVNSSTGHLTVIDLCVTHAATLEKRPKLCVSGFYCPPEASVQVLLSAIGGAAMLEKNPAATLNMIFASVPASVRSSLKRWSTPTSISPIHPASMVWSLAAMFYDLLFPQAAVAAQQLATRYDSEHPLAAAAASSLKGKASSFIVCLNKDLSHLEQLRPYPALHTLMSGALSVEPYHRTVTITAMLSLLPAAKEELLQHKAREQQQAAAKTSAEREEQLQQQLGELTQKVADLQQQLAAATAFQQGVKPWEGVMLPSIQCRRSSGGNDASSPKLSTVSEEETMEPSTPAAAVSLQQPAQYL
jgi:serine/threonine protein kinase